MAAESRYWDTLYGERAEDVRDRFRGCLLGGAVGDALGAPVEFMRLGEIRRAFGESGIHDFAPAYGRIGAITDDTQMTLFTAEGLLAFWVRERIEGLANLGCCVSVAYQRWLMTQRSGRLASMPIMDVSRKSWLLGQRELWASRAPGGTCMSALFAARDAGDAAVNDSKGCGGVMRAAPVGMFAVASAFGPEWVFRTGCEVAGLSHGHPTGRLAAGALATVVHGVLETRSLRTAIETAIDQLERHEQNEETLHAIERACDLARSRAPSAGHLRALGEGWVAEEALAIALYCALVADDLESGVRLAVLHDGDSDSTGAICGNILGALHGARSIPARWLEPLELREVIEEVADDLATYRAWPISGADDPPEQITPETHHYRAKYPPST